MSEVNDMAMAMYIVQECQVVIVVLLRQSCKMFLIFSFLRRWYSLVLSGREQQQSSGMNNHNNKSRDRVGTASSCSLKT